MCNVMGSERNAHREDNCTLFSRKDMQNYCNNHKTTSYHAEKTCENKSLAALLCTLVYFVAISLLRSFVSIVSVMLVPDRC